MAVVLGTNYSSVSPVETPNSGHVDRHKNGYRNKGRHMGAQHDENPEAGGLCESREEWNTKAILGISQVQTYDMQDIW
jgi:hypothetical protein